MKTEEIKQYIGEFIRLTYNSQTSDRSQTGVITALSKIQLLFNVNKSHIEIPVKNNDVINIELIP